MSVKIRERRLGSKRPINQSERAKLLFSQSDWFDITLLRHVLPLITDLPKADLGDGAFDIFEHNKMRVKVR